jgi:nucleoside 2-deoxyribosyltransferase
MKVYLCGGIHALADAEAQEWRGRAKALLASHATVLDPMLRVRREVSNSELHSFISSDLREIAESDALIVNATRPSWGTAMEIVYARLLQRRIVAFVDPREKSVSPWLRYHCEIHPSLEEAVASLVNPTS